MARTRREATSGSPCRSAACQTGPHLQGGTGAVKVGEGVDVVPGRGPHGGGPPDLVDLVLVRSLLDQVPKHWDLRGHRVHSLA